MNAKLIYAATIAIALLGSSAAMAVEATQFTPPAGTLTRAAVKSELVQAKTNGQLLRSFETDQRVSQPGPLTASVRAREEVRAEARYAARHHELNDLYLGE
jgi:hypothetical protein